MKLPIIETERLILKTLTIEDAPAVMNLAKDKKVADTTLSIPHPYEEGMAEEWISTHLQMFFHKKGINLGIFLKENNEFIGSLGLMGSNSFNRVELGYWIGVPYWCKGYATEASKALIDYGFKILKYHKITAHYISCNPASGRVMAKCGMIKEGEMKDHVRKDGVYHDLIAYGLINPAE